MALAYSHRTQQTLSLVQQNIYFHTSQKNLYNIAVKIDKTNEPIQSWTEPEPETVITLSF